MNAAGTCTTNDRCREGGDSEAVCDHSPVFGQWVCLCGDLFEGARCDGLCLKPRR